MKFIQTKKNGDHTLAIITDITKAFDHVTLEILNEKLLQSKFNKYLANMIHQFLHNRKFTSSDGNANKIVFDCLPQGSTLRDTFQYLYGTPA